MNCVSQALAVYDQLSQQLSSLRFSSPVSHVYNPLIYAREPHAAYFRRYAGSPREILLLGMNPGPWGMAQTGVPFGDCTMVREWLGIYGEVKKPEREHPQRPIRGFHCTRSEVSGTRLWGWARDTFGVPERFFERFFVLNYCPLVFMEASGRNFTPDKLRVSERLPLLEACDQALADVVALMQPTAVLGIGKFAEGRAKAVLGGKVPCIGCLPHPSPASPAANRGWAESVNRALAHCGVTIGALNSLTRGGS